MCDVYISAKISGYMTAKEVGRPMGAKGVDLGPEHRYAILNIPDGWMVYPREKAVQENRVYKELKVKEMPTEYFFLPENLKGKRFPDDLEFSVDDSVLVQMTDTDLEWSSITADDIADAWEEWLKMPGHDDFDIRPKGLKATVHDELGNHLGWMPKMTPREILSLTVDDVDKIISSFFEDME